MTWQRYLRDNLKIFSMYCFFGDLEDVLANDKNFWLVGPQIKRVCEASSAGKCMLAHAWAQVSRQLWREDLEKKLADVEHQDFADVPFASFKEAMTLYAKASTMKDDKGKTFKVTFNYQQTSCNVLPSSIHEEWQTLMEKRLRECAMRTQLLPMLPFEKLLHDGLADIAPGVSEFCRISAAHVARALSAREFALELIDESMTVQEQLRVLKSKEKVLKKTDPFWCIEMALHGQVQDLVEAKVQQAVLAEMPAPDQEDQPSMKQVVSMMNKL